MLRPLFMESLAEAVKDLFKETEESRILARNIAEGSPFAQQILETLAHSYETIRSQNRRAGLRFLQTVQAKKEALAAGSHLIDQDIEEAAKTDHCRPKVYVQNIPLLYLAAIDRIRQNIGQGIQSSKPSIHGQFNEFIFTTLYTSPQGSLNFALQRPNNLPANSWPDFYDFFDARYPYSADFFPPDGSGVFRATFKPDPNRHLEQITNFGGLLNPAKTGKEAMESLLARLYGEPRELDMKLFVDYLRKKEFTFEDLT